MIANFFELPNDTKNKEKKKKKKKKQDSSPFIRVLRILFVTSVRAGTSYARAVMIFKIEAFTLITFQANLTA